MKVIRYEVNRENGTIELKATGTEEQLSSQARAIIRGIYREIWKEDKDAADVFRIKLIGYLADAESLRAQPLVAGAENESENSAIEEDSQ